MVTDEFEDDTPNSNVQYQPGTEPNPLTGEQPGEFPEAIGPELPDHPGWYALGSGFNTPKHQFQLGAQIKERGKTFVVVPDPQNPGSVFHAHWEEQQD